MTKRTKIFGIRYETTADLVVMTVVMLVALYFLAKVMARA